MSVLLQLYSVSVDGTMPPYGPADWAIFGVANFFRRHQCNVICRALGLPVNRVKVEGPYATVPVMNVGINPLYQTIPVGAP